MFPSLLLFLTAQYWYKDSTGYIRSKIDINKCLVGSGGRTTKGTELMIYDCFSNDSRFMWDVVRCVSSPAIVFVFEIFKHRFLTYSFFIWMVLSFFDLKYLFNWSLNSIKMDQSDQETTMMFVLDLAPQREVDKIWSYMIATRNTANLSLIQAPIHFLRIWRITFGRKMITGTMPLTWNQLQWKMDWGSSTLLTAALHVSSCLFSILGQKRIFKN